MTPTLRAVLGPTNTGKTYLAVERMTAHQTGMIGFPLRLLARENYDRIAEKHGRTSVALITGEEKLIPPKPRWYVCTVEAMPLDLTVDFLAVDEVQLCADPERGHVFTDRLLRARGREETMFLGSDSMAGMIRSLIPDIQIETRPRFSTLSWAGEAKLNRLPRRSAIVAFSVDKVYEMAETLRRQRGGTAVVLGALSPRTRNAQVEMYQAGEVDYLVATDAIGMGLNMDVDHVAFAALQKYDGSRRRPLTAPEMGQIAGRAGRHMNDGSFGITNERKPPDEEIIRRIVEHDYPPVQRLYWRNASLDFGSPKRLLASLREPALRPELSRARDADDQLALDALIRDDAVMARSGTPEAVHLLWDVCQIPDFRKVMADHHAQLLGRVFLTLRDNNGALPEDWVAEQIARLDRTDGDIDTLTNRIAHVRTWTYISHRSDWLADAAHWQERARAIEDTLSDALHRALINRFVDKRAAMLGRGKGKGDATASIVNAKGHVLVEGHVVGRLDGLRFQPEDAADRREAKALIAAARQAIDAALPGIVSSLENAPDPDFGVSPDGKITWRGRSLACLTAGENLLRPGLRLDRDTVLDTGTESVLTERVKAKLQDFLDGFIRRRLSVLLEEAAPEALGASGRGILYHLREGLGAVHRKEIAGLIDNAPGEDKAALKAMGMRLGVDWVYLDGLLSTRAVRARALAWAAWKGAPVPETPSVSGHGSRAIPTVPSASGPPEAWPCIGYVPMASKALRMDRYEALAALLRRAKGGPITCDKAFFETTALPDTDAATEVLQSLGYRKVEGAATDQIDPPLQFEKRKSSRKKTPGRKSAGRKTKAKPANHKQMDPNSPFAVLKNWGKS